MTILTGPRKLTDEESNAITLYLTHEPIEEIERRTGLSRQEIAAAADLVRTHAQVLTAARSTAGRPAPAGQPLQRPPLTAALAWAEQSKDLKTQTLAAQIRLLVRELRSQHAARGTERATATSAKKPPRPAPARPAPRKDRTAQAAPSETDIRKWAAAEGFDLTGRELPGWLVHRYQDAHAGHTTNS